MPDYLQLLAVLEFLRSESTVLTTLGIFLSTFAFSIVTDLGRTVLEVFFNFLYRKKQARTLCELSPSEVVIVIPCHNSEQEITATLKTLPLSYKVYCVLNACKDNTKGVIKALGLENVEVVETKEPGKIRAVLLGALKARNDGYSHFMLLDDDIEWSTLFPTIKVFSKETPVTALPVIPTKEPNNWLRACQTIEYQIMCASKRAQANLGNVIMASGAAGIYRIDTFLEAVKEHDGEHIGDDLQCSYIHHTKGLRIDFVAEEVVRTKPPYGLGAWWKQRARRWEASPVFNLYWAMRIIFSSFRKGREPGWWIRGVTLYRSLVIVNDVLRLFSFPFVVLFAPQTLVGVWLITYCSVVLKLITFRYFFKKEPYVHWDAVMYSSILTYPVYGSLMWISRIAAIPKGLRLNWLYYVRGKRKTARLSGLISTLEKELVA